MKQLDYHPGQHRVDVRQLVPGGAGPGSNTSPVGGDTSLAQHAIVEQLPELASFQPRRGLRSSELYRLHADEIRRVTFGVEVGKARSRLAETPRRQPAQFLRCVSWNVERGRRLSGIVGLLREHPMLSTADVLLLPEVDVGMARSGNLHVAREIAHALGFSYAFGNSYLCLGAGNPRDGQVQAANASGLHGNAILSRHPIVAAENVSVAITKDKLRSSEPRLGHKKALGAELSTPWGSLGVLVVHLDSSAGPKERACQLKDALQLVGRSPSGLPWLVGGDLNTTTYDAQTPLRLAASLAVKFWRGGFPHALTHYLHPGLLYERAVFQELTAAGLTTSGFNAEGVGTVRYEVGDWESESKLGDHMPAFAARYLACKLRPFGGVAAFKLDWFAARGLRPLGAGELSDDVGAGGVGSTRAQVVSSSPSTLGSRSSMEPCVIERLAWNGERLSDHDPIVVDVVADG